jgi:hypothetical protein
MRRLTGQKPIVAVQSKHKICKTGRYKQVLQPTREAIFITKLPSGYVFKICDNAIWNKPFHFRAGGMACFTSSMRKSVINSKIAVFFKLYSLKSPIYIIYLEQMTYNFRYSRLREVFPADRGYYLLA